MAQPSVSSSSPADQDTDVFVNIALTATFTTDLLSSSINTTTCTLIDESTDHVVATTVALSGTNIVVITPIGILAEDTVYRISFPGTDTALSSSYVIKDSTGEALTTTISITFRTGSRSYIDDTSVDKDAGDLSLEGDLSLPTNVKALGDFVVSQTLPKNRSADVDTTLNGSNQVVIRFDNNIGTGIFNSDMVDVEVFPLLDNTTWLAASGAFGSYIPSYTVAASGAEISISFDNTVPNNLGIQVQLDQSLQDSDGTEFGPNDYMYSITTDRWPNISGPNRIKRELKALGPNDLTDEYIASVLLSKSVEFATKFDLGTTAELSKDKWVVYSTIVDILDDKELEKAIVAGTRRQLGDLNVSVDPIVGKLSLKHARALKAVEDAERSLYKGSLVAKVFCQEGDAVIRNNRRWYGVNGRILSTRFITHQPNIPASNSALNRNSKIPPGDYYWL